MRSCGLRRRRSRSSRWPIPADLLNRRTADSHVLADLLGGGLPRHRRREVAPDAVEYPDDAGGTGRAGDVDRSAGVPLLADGAMPHREPAVVDGFDGPAGFAGAH